MILREVIRPVLMEVAKRFVEEAVVAKKDVEVAFARVVVPETERPPEKTEVIAVEVAKSAWPAIEP